MFGGINGTAGNKGIMAGINGLNGWVEAILWDDDGELGGGVVTMGTITAFPGGIWVRLC